jgi:hypothetical protein
MGIFKKREVFLFMRLTGQQNMIITKLNKGVKFGMYDGGKSCYFEDGTRVDYKDLWDAIRTINNLDRSHSKTIFELCPNNYLGTFPHKFGKHKWRKRVMALFSGSN